jgi:aminoglycoside N3'-acetyltransferase
MPQKIMEKSIDQPSPSRTRFGSADLVAALRDIGLGEGESVFVHSSFKSLGSIKGGALTVIRSLEAAVGPAGHVLMPSFHLIARSKRAEMWNLESTPASTGWLTEFFRTLQGTLRSDHYSHSVAVRGPNAAHWVSGGRPEQGLASPWDLDPWMRAFGVNSPIYKCYTENAKVLLLGADYDSLTFLYLAEVMDWNKRLAENLLAEFRVIDRDIVGGICDAGGKVRFGTVGLAHCRVFSARELIDDLLARIAAGEGIFKAEKSS